MTIINITTITLESGAHDNAESGMCLLEAVAYVAGEPHSDQPVCTSPVLGTFGRLLNDVLPTEKRQALRDFIPAMIGTAGDGLDESRSYVALDWLIRTWMPTFLALHESTREHATAARALPPIVDMATAEQAGVVARAAWTAAGDAAVAAWAAAGDAAVAAWDAARDAAGDAAVAAVAAWAAAGDAAGDAAWAAWTAAWDAARTAAWDAARDAAGDFLAPTVSELQNSAIALMGRMIDPTSPDSSTTTTGEQ